MSRRRFRYDRELGRMVEIVTEDEMQRLHGIVGDIEPFRSPRDGTVIRSRAHLQDYMARHDLVTYDPGIAANGQRSLAERQRDARARRELMWEKLNRTFSMGNKPRSNRVKD